MNLIWHIHNRRYLNSTWKHNIFASKFWVKTESSEDSQIGDLPASDIIEFSIPFSLLAQSIVKNISSSPVNGNERTGQVLRPRILKLKLSCLKPSGTSSRLRFFRVIKIKIFPSRSILTPMQQKPDQGIAKLKLVLWYTVNFRPIMSHRFLEFILSTLGFVGLPPSKPITASTMAWREYVYPAGGPWRRRLREGQQPPRPKLPYPMIDGLHISTYKAFIDAVEFYLGRDISDIFHVRFAYLAWSSFGM